MAYTPINNGDTGLTARGIINGIGTGLDTHIGKSGSDAHALGTIAMQSASLVNITGGTFSGSKISSASAVLGGAEGQIEIDPTGHITLTGSSVCWDDLFFPLLSGKQGATDKPAYDTAEMGYLFPNNDATQFIYITAQMPHRWKLGSKVYPHVHWNQNHSGSVVYKMDYKWFPIGGSVPAAWSTYVMNKPEVLYTSGSTHQLTESTTDGISGSHISNVSSLMLIKLYRDDATYTGNAITYQFDIHIQIDGFGSQSELHK